MLLVIAVGSGRGGGRFPSVRNVFRGRGRGFGRNEYGSRGEFSGRGRDPSVRWGGIEGYQPGRVEGYQPVRGEGYQQQGRGRGGRNQNAGFR